jgi:CubicO group peptidase (beta-lactamase class C family)
VSADASRWHQRLTDLAARHGVPGASLAILDDGAITTAVTGVLNLETGTSVTPDSVFQVGSITKVWTATMLMQLADEGLLDLNAPLSQVLPELSLATAGATDEITVTHLLSHSSGIDGDVFDDFGRGADCIERYVTGCARLPLIHPVGATMSYCNSGFVIAGRVIEVLTGSFWDDALRTRLIEPLGLCRTMTLPEEAIRFGAACGHLDIDGQQRLAPVWALPGGAGPAGGIVATAGDILEFARLHLRGGIAADGARVLPADSAAAMLQPQITVPSYPPGSRQVGLGWQLFDWNGRQLFGHDGGTIGQYSSLVVVPDRDAAVCLLTNGGQAGHLFQDLFTEIFAELWQVQVPAMTEPAADPGSVLVQADRYVGRYEREGRRIEVRAAGDGLEVTQTTTGALAVFDPGAEAETAPLLPVAEGVFASRLTDDDPWSVLVFYRVDGDGYVHSSGRATPKRD